MFSCSGMALFGIKKMSRSDRLQAIEALWDSLLYEKVANTSRIACRPILNPW